MGCQSASPSYFASPGPGCASAPFPLTPVFQAGYAVESQAFAGQRSVSFASYVDRSPCMSQSLADTSPMVAGPLRRRATTDFGNDYGLLSVNMAEMVSPVAASPRMGPARTRAQTDYEVPQTNPHERGFKRSQTMGFATAPLTKSLAAPPGAPSTGPLFRGSRKHQTMGASPGSSPTNCAATEASSASFSGSLPTFRGQPYTPGPRSVLVIAPGGGTRMNAPAYQALRQAGWDITVAEGPEYDRSPAYPDFLYPPGWEHGTPDLSMNGGKNLATLADNVIMPMIEQLIAAGRGPAAIICGSRGGHVPMPRLWACGWRGPTLCVNGGCMKQEIPDSPVRLILITGGQDYFETKDPRWTEANLRKCGTHGHPVLVYHDHKEGHMPGSMGDVFGPLLEIAIDEENFLSTAAAAAAGPCMLPHPRAQRHGVHLKAL